LKSSRLRAFQQTLTNQEEFDLLYVDWLTEQTKRFETWLQDQSANSVAVTGQIGCGKTTFIKRAFFKTLTKPDITINLESISYISAGSFWAAFLLELLKYAKQNNIETQKYGFHILYDSVITSIEEFIAILEPSINLEFLKRQEIIFSKIENNVHHLKIVISDLCKKIEERLGRKIFIYAEGVDKFNTSEYLYLLNKELLNFLHNFKTLYETNLVHVFCNDEWRMNTEQIVLTTASNQVIKEMFKKRLGIYAIEFEAVMPELFKLSGGNFRQALRLLTSYEFSIRKIHTSKTEALEYAGKVVRQDLLSINSSDIELLKVIHKDGYIKDSTIINDRSGNLAVFSNQIFITSEKDKSNNWQAIANPLLCETVNNFRATVNEDFEIENYGQIAKFELKRIFNSLASYFLNKGRNEINVIAYNDLEIAKILNDYLVGRAGAYDELLYQDFEISNTNVHELYNTEDKYYDGISCFFLEDLDSENIKLLEINRNRLIKRNMIWWIHENHIYKYISEWFHLRQFMRFFNLETDIVSRIEIQDVEQDIEDLELLDYSENDSKIIKSRLDKVLEYLKSKEDA